MKLPNLSLTHVSLIQPTAERILLHGKDNGVKSKLINGLIN